MFNMETTFETITWAGVAALFTWFILKPLTFLIIAKWNKTDMSADARLCKLEENDLKHIQIQVDSIERRLDDFQRQFGVIGERLATLEQITRK
jgi:hypothetical protein